MKKYLFSITAIVIAVLINSISFAQTHASTNFQLMYGPGSPSDGSIIVRLETRAGHLFLCLALVPVRLACNYHFRNTFMFSQGLFFEEMKEWNEKFI